MFFSSSYSYGLCGIHYIDAGYLGFKAYFTAPRKGTVWVSPRLHYTGKRLLYSPAGGQEEAVVLDRKREMYGNCIIRDKGYA